MNIYALEHIPESKYCFAISKNQVKIRIRVAKEDKISKLNIIYGCKYDFQNERQVQELRKTYETEFFAYYETLLNLKDVRLVYIFEIIEGDKKYFYSEDGLTLDYDFSKSFYNCFQYSYINENDLFPLIDWTKKAVFYQIFIDRFNIGNLKKDKSYINLNWGDIPTPKSFAGGDLKGIEEKLSYLKEIGFNALYLTPIFDSISNHKYDTRDYFKIDKHFGDKQDLMDLVSKAHELGMKVVLDAVFNHASEELYQFQDVLKNGKNSKYYDWFIFNDDGGYETFAHCKYMPKFNTANKDVQDYLISIALHYIHVFDIDGWRLDVSDEVSHEFWKIFRKAIKNAKSSCIIIGENWHDAQSFLRGDEFDSIMNYAFTKACLDFYAYDKFNAKDMSNKLNELLTRNNDYTNQMMLNLLDTHDTLRFLTEVKGNKNKLYSALCILFLYIGIPCIYYGTEVDMIGGYDPDSRRTYDWLYKNNETKILINKLASLRSNVLLNYPNIRIYERNDLLVLERNNSKNNIILYINNSSTNIHINSTNTIICNQYDKNILKPNGFVIFKE